MRNENPRFTLESNGHRLIMATETEVRRYADDLRAKGFPEEAAKLMASLQELKILMGAA